MLLPAINAIWIGSTLGPIHGACLRSFVRQGHRTVLHVYEEPNDTPEGIQLADAGTLLSSNKIFKHKKSGSYAVFADLLRYEVVKANLGIYVDCDLYCVRPIYDEEYIFGWLTNQLIANAVIKMPCNSPALSDLCSIKDDPNFIPPWFSGRKQFRYRLTRFLGRERSLSSMPWGSTGPDALTWFARKNNIHNYAKPIDVFYPLAHYQTDLLFDPGLGVEELLTHRSVGIHLFNEVIRHRDLKSIPKGSPLWQIISS